MRVPHGRVHMGCETIPQDVRTYRLRNVPVSPDGPISFAPIHNLQKAAMTSAVITEDIGQRSKNTINRPAQTQVSAEFSLQAKPVGDGQVRRL